MKPYVLYPPEYNKERDKLLKKHKAPDIASAFESAQREIEENPVSPHIWKIGATGFYIYAIRKTNPEFRIIYYHGACRCIESPTANGACAFVEPDDTHRPEVCNGVIYFLRINTREKMNNIYETERRIALRKVANAFER